MKYCLNYWRKSHYLDTIDELTIDFQAADIDEFDNFIKFLDAHPNQKINLMVKKENIKEFFKKGFPQLFIALWNDKTEYQHFAIQFFELAEDGPIPEEVLIFLQLTSRCPCYLGRFITTPELFSYLIDCGANEIYVGGDLGFSLPIVSQKAKRNNVKIRMVPNYAQGATYTKPLLKFFVRPEDICLYEDYVDVCEIYDKGNVAEVTYEAYQDREWFGPIEEIVQGLKSLDSKIVLDNRAVLPQFGQLRLICQHECLTKGGCDICSSIKEISDLLIDNNLAIKTKFEPKEDE